MSDIELNNNQNDLDIIKTTLEKTFGIKIDNIEFKKLKNGRSVIAFYDKNIGRKRLIDYSYDNSDRELSMIDIEKLRNNYYEVIKEIPSDEQYKVDMINKLINEVSLNNIKYINIENSVAIDSEGNIVETSLNRENSIDNEIMPTEFEIEEDANFPDDSFTGDDFKKIVKDEMEKHNINTSIDEEYDKVVKYSGNLMKLEIDFEDHIIDENQYEFYKDLTEKYLDSRPLQRIEVRTLGYKNKESGYTIIFIIAFIAIIIGAIIIILLNR